MPLIIENNYDSVSLADLVMLRKQGYSVLRSPHVGNQHPSSLVCAALGIPLKMVSFTKGRRDVNSHPHLRIENRESAPLYSADTWTQFAYTPCGQTATEYHQSAVKRVFPQTEIITDMQQMQQYPCLAAIVLQATNIRLTQSVWYRKVSADGVVTNCSRKPLTPDELETDVFQFSNDASGWVIPNKVHCIFDLIYQALSSGRSIVYHLSGPQMVQYIDGIKEDLSLLYDAVRQQIPDLPLVLKVRVVSVADCRFVVHTRNAATLQDVCKVLRQSPPPIDGRLAEVAHLLPEVTRSIESAATLSQYDLSSVDDLFLDPWMVNTPLSVVSAMYRMLCDAARTDVQVAAQ